jgi:transcriptional regulator with XRE-family HTH domain
MPALAAILRVQGKQTIYRYETGERVISPQIQILMEMLDAGELPERYRQPV